MCLTPAEHFSFWCAWHLLNTFLSDVLDTCWTLFFLMCLTPAEHFPFRCAWHLLNTFLSDVLDTCWTPFFQMCLTPAEHFSFRCAWHLLNTFQDSLKSSYKKKKKSKTAHQIFSLKSPSIFVTNVTFQTPHSWVSCRGSKLLPYFAQLA